MKNEEEAGGSDEVTTVLTAEISFVVCSCSHGVFSWKRFSFSFSLYDKNEMYKCDLHIVYTHIINE